VIRFIAAPLALAAAAVALAGCGNTEYCVSPRAGTQMCGPAARAWCDDHAQDPAGPETTALPPDATQQLQAACERVGGL
jgi:hypothetical protein